MANTLVIHVVQKDTKLSLNSPLALFTRTLSNLETSYLERVAVPAFNYQMTRVKIIQSESAFETSADHLLVTEEKLNAGPEQLALSIFNETVEPKIIHTLRGTVAGIIRVINRHTANWKVKGKLFWFTKPADVLDTDPVLAVYSELEDMVLELQLKVKALRRLGWLRNDDFLNVDTLELKRGKIPLDHLTLRDV